MLKLLLFFPPGFPLPPSQKFRILNACFVVGEVGHLAFSFSLTEQFAQRRGSVGKFCIPAPHTFCWLCKSFFWRRGSLLILLVRVGEGASCCYLSQMTAGASGLWVGWLGCDSQVSWCSKREVSCVSYGFCSLTLLWCNLSEVLSVCVCVCVCVRVYVCV